MKKACSIFSHPDFTVGSGITPDQSLSLLISESRALDTLDTTCVITAGQEFHLALKMLRYEIKNARGKSILRASRNKPCFNRFLQKNS